MNSITEKTDEFENDLKNWGNPALPISGFFRFPKTPVVFLGSFLLFFVYVYRCAMLYRAELGGHIRRQIGAVIGHDAFLLME